MKLNSFQLKVIAIVLMTFSHIEYHMNISNSLLIGQAAFPIFAFLSAIAIDKTRDPLKYVTRILLFGIVMQIPLLILKIEFVNVFLTIAAGGFAILSLKMRNPIVATALIFVAHTYNFDYGSYGVIFIICAYYLKDNWIYLGISLIVLNYIYIEEMSIFSSFQWLSLIAIPLIAIYDGTRGSTRFKYFFYFYYPIHVMIIYLIANYVI